MSIYGVHNYTHILNLTLQCLIFKNCFPDLPLVFLTAPFFMKPLPASIDVMEGHNVQFDGYIESNIDLVQYKGESMRSMQREMARRGFEGRFSRTSQISEASMSPGEGMMMGGMPMAEGGMMGGGIPAEGGMMVGGMPAEGGMMVGGMQAEGGMMAGGMMGVPPCGPKMEAPEFVTKPEDVEVLLGDTAEFSCEISGNPEPELMW